MTQPARKKETATQLELLEAELTAARKVTARCRAAMEKAEKRHGAAEDAQAVAQYRYDRALVASWGDTPDWMTLLDGDEDRSSVMYELAREGLERLGLGTSMINIDTGQRVVWLGFRTDSEAELQQKLRGVQFILPFVKAGSQGQREISICQPQRDKFALSLMVDAQTQAVSVMKRVYGREKERTGFPGLEAALRYIRDIHSDTSIEETVQ
ncbi:hypothetical protein GKP91_04695 [Salmonella enterica subsp. enterica serovar Java]|nr:hypothetical protein [Salmonella enterica]ECE8727082.1 hypothetical protein [Salmonella enterica subsp. enterica serovar Java]EDR9849170.1 hypothetical protein [Salmonella enterica subsp. enterica]EAR4482220.1 hypothetical protein [Salmonella enterica]EAU8491126.1 hypothetical protein [Salmonella enterica]